MSRERCPRICVAHRDQLQAALSLRGLKSLIADDLTLFDITLADVSCSGITLDNFDPLFLGEYFLVSGAFHMGGPAVVEVGCPVCNVIVVHREKCLECTPGRWIEAAAEEMLNQWKELAS